MPTQSSRGFPIAGNSDVPGTATRRLRKSNPPTNPGPIAITTISAIRVLEPLWLRDRFVVLVQILTGNIVLRNLAGSHFGNARIFGVLHTENNARLERISLFKQFFDALRVRSSIARQALITTGLSC